MWQARVEKENPIQSGILQCRYRKEKAGIAVKCTGQSIYPCFAFSVYNTIQCCEMSVEQFGSYYYLHYNSCKQLFPLQVLFF